MNLKKDDVRIFYCKFSHDAACCLSFNYSAYCRNGENDLAPTTRWKGKRQPEYFLPYVRWIHDVNSTLSRIINKKHGYILQHWAADFPTWEFWSYRPDGTKQLVDYGIGSFSRLG